ncbi:ClpX C4-type zinc finger protein [Amycolatopsis jejuensis]|uniref:ClpX C4-type zinc finger protein n=1 Tax=Amycolatopsis jejuensis TaxID=330084 RepID=UPI000A7AEB44|nr:ClpX C4-type zinc finger protein [Amycolatopsis jejuensis]
MTYCSFCLKPAAEVEKLISGAGVYICSGCVELCSEILAGQHEPSTSEMTLWESKSDEEILESIPRMTQVSAQADARIQAQVDLLRSRGVAWARIGAALGVTRQSAWEKFSAERAGS